MKACRFYEQIVEEYDQPNHQRFYQEVAGKLLRDLPNNSAFNSILEIGAGTGFTTLLLRERFPRARIIALEPSAAMLSKAKKKCPDIEYRNQSLAEFGIEHFDLIVCSMSAHWLSEYEWSKLRNLAKKAPLIIALPISPSKTKLPPANLILRKLLFSLKSQPNWPKEARHILRDSDDQISILENYENIEELTNSLYARGVFLSLFGNKADVAKNLFLESLLWEQSPTEKNVDNLNLNFHWSFKLIVTYPKIATSPLKRNMHDSLQ